MKWLSNLIGSKSTAVITVAPPLGEQVFPAHTDYFSVARGWEVDSQEQPDSTKCRLRFENVNGNFVAETIVDGNVRFVSVNYTGDAQSILLRGTNLAFNKYILFRAV